MNRKFSFAVDEFYHLYNRGNDRREIFLDPGDHKRFLMLMFLCNSSKRVLSKDAKGISFSEIDRGGTLVDIGAYCLMPNHFHILVREKIPNGISLFMKKLSTAYSMYFNLKYNRTGKLFENAFKATHVDDDVYLKYLFAYIHLNPVKLIDSKWKESEIADRMEAKRYLGEYPYSSYVDYMDAEREEGMILGRQAFPEYFLSSTDFDSLVNDWLLFAE